ncbi:MAG: hypothetical protein J3K34DRAFT_434102 [Monoraphidium minutum]|nr:MAG: hypothetical protein J3K34DRAFT_434102 [Monoraphidium minutum]
MKGIVRHVGFLLTLLASTCGQNIDLAQCMVMQERATEFKFSMVKSPLPSEKGQICFQVNIPNVPAQEAAADCPECCSGLEANRMVMTLSLETQSICTKSTKKSLFRRLKWTFGGVAATRKFSHKSNVLTITIPKFQQYAFQHELCARPSGRKQYPCNTTDALCSGNMTCTAKLVVRDGSKRDNKCCYSKANFMAYPESLKPPEDVLPTQLPVESSPSPPISPTPNFNDSSSPTLPSLPLPLPSPPSSPPPSTGPVPNSMQCAPGTGGDACNGCDRGTHSMGGNITVPNPQCEPCSIGWTTKTIKATSAIDCSVRICSSGRGGANCEVCPHGTFSTGGNTLDPNIDCVRCPAGSYTLRVGSKALADCYRIPAPRCPNGYFLAHSSCHIAPLGTYSLGGTRAAPTLCPKNTITKGVGSIHMSACTIPAGHPQRSFSWADGEEFLTQTCRSDLFELLAADQWQGNIVARLRSDTGSCKTQPEGIAELKVLYESKIISIGSLELLLQPAVNGSLQLKWIDATSVNRYEGIWGTTNPTAVATTLPAWSNASDFETTYKGIQAKIVAGTLTQAVVTMADPTQFEMLSLIEEALEARLTTALSYFGGNMNRAQLQMALYLRHAQTLVFNQRSAQASKYGNVVYSDNVTWIKAISGPLQAKSMVASDQGRPPCLESSSM